MLSTLPLALFALVVFATLLRGRSVRTRSGTSAWAFADARGIQRLSGVAFALSSAALGVAAALLALGHIAPAFPLGGTLVVAIGAAIVIVAQVQMGNAWRVGVRDGDASLFVTAGLFRFSRNPIFVGMILMALGIALAADTLWCWAAAAAFAIAYHIQARIEEAHLSREFGPAYDDFRRRVPRWLLV
ncbi:isoprenylcysteine carboxylmethyltransferase family protein [Sphingopyxis sp. BSN-002]|uniref:methyltransferase family protein n=1 Tax=Sphingopyxis sp. BSN-002 TaxID=2911495 RepID=UPI001EDA99E2|nr:isoprenylcysteine carboxylmethyltransferase family protein [Sphingopyxis sp. BSN-002]UKK84576.1 isoprenylcysteine carboxylmethyltransferase family protein [Sphingopyxis sp. BSN-002]